MVDNINLTGEGKMEIKIEDKIEEIAKKHCKDYPNIAYVTPWEQLYAIESYLEGIKLANNDLHKIIKELMKKHNISIEELFKIDKEE